ncbi:hypothetical protein [Salegentibacter mishustinae]|uniref:hypothetical protein n=1 Tax=Salegentibacter mishustinae TaxID=270918 RepID=UPI002490A971|nr:hypothetical protein [Salegentibacter mishustinae]
MKIKLDEENKQLKIDDNIKITYLMLKFVMISKIFQNANSDFQYSGSQLGSSHLALDSHW